MNIAIVRHSIYNRGSDRVIFDYADYLIRQGHQISYYTNEVKTAFDYNKAIKIKEIPGSGKLSTILFVLKTKFNEDIVVFDLIATSCLSWILNRKKLIYFAQGFDTTYYASPLMHAFIGFCYRIALNFLKIPTISASDNLSNKLKTFKPKHLITIPNGVNLLSFHFYPQNQFSDLKANTTVILIYGKHDYVKGMDVAQKCFNKLFEINKTTPWQVWTIGEELKTAGILIKNFGFLNNEKLRDILSAADIFLLPSRNEGLSTLLLQALACECAVVATEAANIITHEVDGLISPIEDGEGLAKNLDRVLRDDSLREKLRKNARKLAEQYSLEKSCQKFEEAILTFTNQKAL